MYLYGAIMEPENRIKIFKSIIPILLLFVIGDIISTYLAIEYFNVGYEGNSLISGLSIFMLTIIKLLFIIWIYITYKLTPTIYKKYWYIQNNIIGLMGLLICINNFGVIYYAL